jgi:hypothetical protein
MLTIEDVGQASLISPLTTGATAMTVEQERH